MSKQSTPRLTGGQRLIRTGAVGTISAILAACATAPDPNPQFDAATSEFESLKGIPGVEARAGVAYREAEDAYSRAQAAWQSERDKAEVDHLATLAERRAQIARSVASREMAQEKIESSARERDQLLMDNRQLMVDQERARSQLLKRENSSLRAENMNAQQKLVKLNEELSALEAQKTERGSVVTLDGVLFESASAVLKAGADRKLSQVAELLQDHPGRQVMIEGFTDSTGNESSNLSLSQRRADSVRIDLIRKGVAPERIKARGLGEAYPVASNDIAAGRQQNRRVELIISDDSGTVQERASLAK